MRQVFLEKGDVVVQRVAQPQLDDYSVLVSVHYSCISSGTENATIENAKTAKNIFGNATQKVKAVFASLAKNGFEDTKTLVKNHLKGPIQSLGYSCSGRVIAVGSKVRTLRAGDFVACAGSEYAHHADIICVPENLVVRVSDQTLLRQASITTVAAIALQGIRRAQLQLGDIVCVQGLGLLGQITVQLAKTAGCTVVGIDILSERMELAKQLGADHVFNANDQQLQKSIEFLTHHKGVDATLITASGKSNDIVQQAMNITRKKGKVVVVGDVGLKLERSPFYQKEIDFLISCSYGPGRYDYHYECESKDYPYSYVRWTEKRNMQTIIEMLEQKKIVVDPLLSSDFSIEQAAQAYKFIGAKKMVGAILNYLPKNDFEFAPAIKTSVEVIEKVEPFIPARKDKLNVGFVGAGGFAQMKLLPLVSKISGLSLQAVSDTNIVNAKQVSRTYAIDKVFTQEQDLFTDKSIDVVIIASPHKFHAQQAIKALSMGKAVFIEKPMATTFDQLEQLNTFLKNNPQVPFCVDYNRSFSPFIRKIKWELADRHSPLVMTYRMNAGYIAPDHWIQREVGAGRVIGEACHIIDLFCFLTGSEPRSVSVEALRPSSDDLFPTDNFMTQISFKDGSICSLVYTSVGHSALGKERLELFFDSKTIVMDDFYSIRGYATSHNFNETVSVQDKGHQNLLEQFFNGIKQETIQLPMTFDHLNTVAKLTLIIDKLVCSGGGEQSFL